MAVQQRRGRSRAQTAHESSRRFAGRFQLLIAFTFVATPPVLFYTVLLRSAINIPFYDDYTAVLSFLNQFTQLHGFGTKASFFLASQYNEYKLFFLHALAILQFSLFGQINFLALAFVGNSFVLLLGILLWKMFLPNHANLAVRLGLFIPVSWLLFQLEYWETLNWSMAGLQNIPVLVFSLGAIYLLVKGTRSAFCWALLSFVFAVASSGNGLLLIPVGLLILFFSRSYLRIASWLLVAAVCVAAYSYRYNLFSSQAGTHLSVIAGFNPLAPAYILAFIGCAARFPVVAGSIFLGTLICILFVVMVRRGYTRRNPLVSYCVLFLLLTAFGVAGIRSDMGIFQATSSRYSIYSALLLIFCWFILVEEFLPNQQISFLNNNIFLAAVTVAVLFSLLMDAIGTMQLDRRSQALVQAMAAFEHPTTGGSNITPSPPLSSGPPSPIEAEFYHQARTELLKAEQLGIYRPPD
jgi:hypothetical protein